MMLRSLRIIFCTPAAHNVENIFLDVHQELACSEGIVLINDTQQQISAFITTVPKIENTLSGVCAKTPFFNKKAFNTLPFHTLVTSGYLELVLCPGAGARCGVYILCFVEILKAGTAGADRCERRVHFRTVVILREAVTKARKGTKQVRSAWWADKLGMGRVVLL